MSKRFDIVVIGGGPGGYVAAIKAAQEGKKVCLVEKEKVGGTCLNVGCIPTKALLKSADYLKKVKESSQFGIADLDTSNVSINMDLVQKRKNSVVGQLVGGVEGLLMGNGVEVIQGQASIKDRNTVLAGGNEIATDNIIIATGSVPKMLPIEVDDDAHVMTSVEALNLDAIPGQCVVVGGGVIGIEFAYLLNAIGTKVTVVEFMDRILPMVDEEISAMVTDHLKEEGIAIATSAKATTIEKNHLVYEKDGKVDKVYFDKILMSVGRAPSYEGIDVEGLGIKTERGAICTDKYMKTNIPNIYAIGDVNGQSMLAHTASMEGIVAVENICGHKSRMDYSKIPSAIYIHPEVSSVGMTEKEAAESGKKIKVGKFPFLANGKAKIEGSEKGLIKAISDEETGEILGVHIFGIHSTDMIAEAVVAMNLEATPEEMVKSIHPHPTISEVFHEAFHDIEGGAIHFM